MPSTHLAQFRRFAQYNAWFNERVYDVASELDDDARRRDLGAFFRSLHGTLGHLLLTDRLWLGRFARPQPGNAFDSLASLASAELVYEIDGLDDELFADWDALRAARRATDGVLTDFVLELTPELLASDFHYVNSSGKPFTSPLWHVVAHLFNHQTHHRGQATALLSQLGQDVGMTDFMVAAWLPDLAN